MMRNYTAAPHPFVLEPPETGPQALEPGTELDFGLVLIGQALDLLPWFILAFEFLGSKGLGQKIKGQRGRFCLCSIHQRGQEETLIYQNNTLIAPAVPEALALPSGPVHQVRLSLHSPLRIKYQDQFTSRLDFHILFRSLLRRVFLLAFFHGQKRLDDRNFADLIRQAEDIRSSAETLHWQEQKRWSRRQNMEMHLGGLLGSISYHGNLSPFMPFLEWGAAVHCGKGCTFGLGRYSIECLEVSEEERTPFQLYGNGTNFKELV